MLVQGLTESFSVRIQSAGQSTITFGYDSDANPLNGGQVILNEYDRDATSVDGEQFDPGVVESIEIDTDHLPTGRWHIFATIESNGQSRTVYSDASLLVIDDHRFSLDVDFDTEAQALTDGIVVLRYLAGFSGQPLVNQAVDSDALRQDPEQIAARLQNVPALLDVDGDGQRLPLTDGILLMRYLAGFNGQVLVEDAVGSAATRTSPEQIIAALDALRPASATADYRRHV